MTTPDPAATLPPLTGSQVLSSWTPHPSTTLVLLAALALYLIGVRRLRRRGHGWATRRAVGWMAGLSVIAVATTSVTQVYSGTLFSVSAVQHSAPRTPREVDPVDRTPAVWAQ